MQRRGARPRRSGRRAGARRRAVAFRTRPAVNGRPGGGCSPREISGKRRERQAALALAQAAIPAAGPPRSASSTGAVDSIAAAAAVRYAIVVAPAPPHSPTTASSGPPRTWKARLTASEAVQRSSASCRSCTDRPGVRAVRLVRPDGEHRRVRAWSQARGGGPDEGREAAHCCGRERGDAPARRESVRRRLRTGS